jgi:hypothetical protein
LSSARRPITCPLPASHSALITPATLPPSVPPPPVQDADGSLCPGSQSAMICLLEKQVPFQRVQVRTGRGGVGWVGGRLAAGWLAACSHTRPAPLHSHHTRPNVSSTAAPPPPPQVDMANKPADFKELYHVRGV